MLQNMSSPSTFNIFCVVLKHIAVCHTVKYVIHVTCAMHVRDGCVLDAQVLKTYKSGSSTDLMKKLDECLADGIEDVHCVFK